MKLFERKTKEYFNDKSVKDILIDLKAAVDNHNIGETDIAWKAVKNKVTPEVYQRILKQVIRTDNTGLFAVVRPKDPNFAFTSFSQYGEDHAGRYETKSMTLYAIEQDAGNIARLISIDPENTGEAGYTVISRYKDDGLFVKGKNLTREVIPQQSCIEAAKAKGMFALAGILEDKPTPPPPPIFSL